MKTTATLTLVELENQPKEVRSLPDGERDQLIVSAIRRDGKWRVLCRYGDDSWRFLAKATNTVQAEQYIHFNRLPAAFRAAMKAVVYRYMRRGLGGVRPEASTVLVMVDRIAPFLYHLEKLGIDTLRNVDSTVCMSYAAAAKKGRTGRGGNPLKATTLYKRLQAVEALFELSQFTNMPMDGHPWSDETASKLAGIPRGDTRASSTRNGLTPLMPDDIFSGVFQAAWTVVQEADHLLTLRDKIQEVNLDPDIRSSGPRYVAKNDVLRRLGWSSGVSGLRTALTDLRVACYIVVASLSGCRNHEIALIHAGSYYSTIEDDGEVYWWMRSTSLKTDEGMTVWMIPEAAVEALKVMDRFAAPYQAELRREIRQRRKSDPDDIEIFAAEQHLDAVFVGQDLKKDKQVRTISVQSWNAELKRFLQERGIAWKISSHQFRRAFAHYAARSQFGDLRYLKEHFKHWSIDMTLPYALNDSLAVDLFLDIQFELDSIKEGVVAEWFDKDERLSGGYGLSLMQWRNGSEIALFRSRSDMVRSIAESTAIRSNGHAWCTADDNLCVGNIEVTRCGGDGGCGNAVIGRRFKPVYSGLYNHLAELDDCDDIGPGGRQRVSRDLRRCRSVLSDLGHDPVPAAV